MRVCLLLITALFAETVFAQCDAYYRFDGNLQDSGANGFHGSMFSAVGVPATPRFAEGVQGQSLLLDGKSAMRTYLDLHYDFCPQVTIAGWVRIESERSGAQYIVATGQGGPGVRISGRIAGLMGSGNGLLVYNAVRDPRAWFFFAAVFDYDARTYRFQWRDRIVEGELSDNARPAADSLWVGAYDDRLSYAIDATYVDELRIIGRALSPEEVTRLRGGRQGALTRLENGQTTQTEESKNSIGSVATKRTDITAANLPDRPPLLPGSGLLDATSNDNVQIELEEGVGIGAGGGLTPDANLTMPDDDPASELQDQLDTIAENPPVNLAGRVELKEGVGIGAGGGPTPDANLTKPEDDPGSLLQEDLDALPDQPTIEKVDVIECDTLGDPQWVIYTNTTYPQAFMNALLAAARCDLEPRVILINENDQWVVGAGDQVARSINLPGEMAQTLDDYEDNRGGIDAAEITTNGTWLVASGNRFADSGIPDRARTRAQSIVGSYRRIVSFTINPANASRWLMVDDKGSVYGDVDHPRAILAESANFQSSQQGGTRAQYMLDGSWLLLERDGRFVSNGLPDQTINILDGLRRSGASIDHVLEYRVKGGYLVVSGGAVAVRPNDPIYTVEHVIGGGTIWSRMVAHDITGLQIAVVRNNQIAWTRGYGLLLASDLESYVRPDTTFDFASVSKPIASFALMQLHEAGKLDIGRSGELEDIEDIIQRGQRRKFRDDVRPEAGNIAQVMQQCAGFCYAGARQCQMGGNSGGAKGYSVNLRPMPTTAEALMGRSPAASSHRVVRVANYGLKHQYTSANYILIQALIDIHGGGFVKYTKSLFGDLDMVASTYQSPYPKMFEGNFARGHEDGVLQGSVAYAELAAASLVSTTTDVARFVIALNQDGGNLLSKANFDRYVGRSPAATTYCTNPGNYALGIRRVAADSNWGNNETIKHNGDHNGYHAKMIALPGLQTGVIVVMTSHGDDDGPFFGELRRSLRNAYNF